MEVVKLAYDVYETDETRSDLCPIVLLHGVFWNKFMYRDLARDMCNQTKRKVFCPDLRNHGDSPVCEDGNALTFAEDVKLFLDEKGLKRIAFVCHSFSSTIAYLIALDRPEAVEKILMIDHPPFPDFNEHFIMESVAPQVEIQNRLLKMLDPKMKLRDAKTKFYNLAKMGTKSQEYFYKKAAYDLTKENGKFKWKIDMEFLMRRYTEGKFNVKARGSLEHEILIVRCPESGRVPDSKFEAVLKFNPNARLITLEDTTHLLMFEKTQEFLEIVKHFLYVPSKNN